MVYRNSRWVGKKRIEMKWNACHACNDMNQLTWMRWHDEFEAHEKPVSWNEWIEMNLSKMKELKLKWKNWNERIERNELK